MIDIMDGGTGTGTLGADAPEVGWASGPLGAVQAADREIARQTAVRARAVAEFAAARPSSADRPQGVKGAMSAERWAARPELPRPGREWAAQEGAAGRVTTPAQLGAKARRAVLTRDARAAARALERAVRERGVFWQPGAVDG